MIKPTPDSIYCDQNRHLVCWLRFSRKSHLRRDNCPLNQKRFLDDVYSWAKDGRDARGVNLSTIPGTQNTADDAMVRKADFYVRFNNPDAVKDFILQWQDTGYAKITKEICKDLMRGRKTWKLVGMGITHKRAKNIVSEELSKLAKNIH